MPVINHNSFQAVNVGFIAFTLKNDHNFELAKNIILETAFDNPNLEQGNNYAPQLILDKLHHNTRDDTLRHLIHLSFHVKNISSKHTVYDQLCEKIKEKFKQANIELSIETSPMK